MKDGCILTQFGTGVFKDAQTLVAHYQDVVNVVPRPEALATP
jgi:hypothetical protein